MIIEELALPEALQKHWALFGAKMLKKVSYKGHDVYLADGGPHYDAKHHKIVDAEPGPGELIKGEEWMRDGYYVAVWAVARGTLIIGFPIYCKINHDLNLGKNARQPARLNSVLECAKESIDAMISVGQLEHRQCGILMLH